MIIIRHILLFLIGALLLSGCARPHEFSATILEPSSAAPDFTLTDQNGQPFRLSEQRGKLMLIFFGFTNCPDVCPTELGTLAAVRRELGADAEQVQVALISVDPERDTPERLKTYVSAFDPSFIGLHGEGAALDQVLKDYGVTAIRRDLPNSASAYTMDHSAFVYVIDQQGYWRALFSPGSTMENILNDVRYLVRNPA
jgi:protein SCO1/2